MVWGGISMASPIRLENMRDRVDLLLEQIGLAAALTRKPGSDTKIDYFTRGERT
jgi:hypothetical protein